MLITSNLKFVHNNVFLNDFNKIENLTDFTKATLTFIALDVSYP